MAAADMAVWPRPSRTLGLEEKLLKWSIANSWRVPKLPFDWYHIYYGILTKKRRN